MVQLYKENKILIDKAIFFILFVAGLYIFVNSILTYVAPFIFGYIIAITINPIVNMLSTQLKLSRGVATVVAIIAMLFLISVIGTAIVLRAIQEGAAFFESLPQMIHHIESSIYSVNKLFDNIYQIVPQNLQVIFYGFINVLTGFITSSIGYGIKNFSAIFISIVPRVILGTLLGLISAYFFSKDKEKINSALNNVLPAKIYEKIKIIKVGTINALFGYFKAQFILTSIIAVVCITGLLIIRAPYALFLGLIIAIVDALPVFGSGFFYWPWIALSLIIGDYSQAIGLAIIYITLLLTRQFLEPKIVGKQIGVHPLITLMSIYIGLRLFGFFGILIGPCIVVICKSIMEAPHQK